jgi:hypothetical protein
MSRDELVAGGLVLAFGILVTAQVTLLAGLAARSPRWRALAALVAPPLAPVWGWSTMRRRSMAWLMGAIAYVVLRLVASR